MEKHEKIWGHEEWLVNRDYCGKKLILKKGFRCSMHYHKKKDETFYINKGKVLMEVEGKQKIMLPGDIQNIPINTKHRFTGLEDSEIIEFSTHHEDEDSYRVEPSGEIELKKETTYKKVENEKELIDSFRIRAKVFIVEQGGKPGWEPDEVDKDAIQFVALQEGKVVATARCREIVEREIKIEKMATAKEYRAKNIGKGLMTFMIKDIKKLEPKRIWLKSQLHAQQFYEKCGFKTISQPYDHYGIQHIDMEYQQ